MKLGILAKNEAYAVGAAENWVKLGIQHPWPERAVTFRSIEDARYAWRIHRELPHLYLVVPSGARHRYFEAIKVEEKPPNPHTELELWCDRRPHLVPVTRFDGKDDEVHISREIWYPRMKERGRPALTLCQVGGGDRLLNGAKATCEKCLRLVVHAPSGLYVHQFG